MLKRFLVLSILFCVLLVGAYGVPEGYVIPSDSDFVWVKDSNGYLKEGELGYWLYIGSDEYVQIPEVIQGYSMVKTNHYRMFYGNAMVKGVSLKHEIYGLRETFTMMVVDEFEIDFLDLTKVVVEIVDSFKGSRIGYLTIGDNYSMPGYGVLAGECKGFLSGVEFGDLVIGDNVFSGSYLEGFLDDVVVDSLVIGNNFGKEAILFGSIFTNIEIAGDLVIGDNFLEGFVTKYTHDSSPPVDVFSVVRVGGNVLVGDNAFKDGTTFNTFFGVPYDSEEVFSYVGGRLELGSNFAVGVVGSNNTFSGLEVEGEIVIGDNFFSNSGGASFLFKGSKIKGNLVIGEAAFLGANIVSFFAEDAVFKGEVLIGDSFGRDVVGSSHGFLKNAVISGKVVFGKDAFAGSGGLSYFFQETDCYEDVIFDEGFFSFGGVGGSSYGVFIESVFRKNLYFGKGSFAGLKGNYTLYKVDIDGDIIFGEGSFKETESSYSILEEVKIGGSVVIEDGCFKDSVNINGFFNESLLLEDIVLGVDVFKGSGKVERFLMGSRVVGSIFVAEGSFCDVGELNFFLGGYTNSSEDNVVVGGDVTFAKGVAKDLKGAIGLFNGLSVAGTFTISDDSFYKSVEVLEDTFKYTFMFYNSEFGYLDFSDITSEMGPFDGPGGMFNNLNVLDGAYAKDSEKEVEYNGYLDLVGNTNFVFGGIRTYKVVFKDYIGILLGEQLIEKYQDAVAPEVQVRQGYSFVGWSKDFTNVTSNMEVYPLYVLEDVKELIAVPVKIELCVKPLDLVTGLKDLSLGNTSLGNLLIKSVEFVSEVGWVQDDAFVQYAGEHLNEKRFWITVFGQDLKKGKVLVNQDIDLGKDFELPVEFSVAPQGVVEDNIGLGVFKIDVELIKPEISSILDLTVLEALIADVESLDRTNYPSDVWGYFEGVYLAALKLPISTQDEVDLKVETILRALEKLYVESTPLNVLMDEANSLVESDFTSEGWGILQAVVAMPQNTSSQVASKVYELSNVLECMGNYYSNNYVLATDSDFQVMSGNRYRYIGDSRFVIIPETINGTVVTSYEGMFRSKTIYGVKSNSTNVVNMSSMFNNIKTYNLDLSGLNVTSVTNMSEMFRGMKGIDITFWSNSKASNVTNMSRMFERADLKFLDFGDNFDASKVVDMSKMFDKCSIGAVNFGSNFDARKVTNVTDMFHGSEINTVDFGGSSNFSSLKNAESMFRSSYINNLYFGENFNVSSLTNVNNMFGSGIKSIDFGENFIATSLVKASGMFSGSKAAVIDLQGFDTSNVENMNRMFYRTAAKVIKLGGKFNTSKVTDMGEMFSYNTVLETIEGLNTFDTTNVTNMEKMFSDCYRLKTLDLSSFNTENVTNMSRMFSTMFDIVSLDLSSFNTEKVTDMSYMFASCVAEDIIFGGAFDTSSVTNMEGMFSSTGVKSLDLSGFNTGLVTNMVSMFSNSSVTNIDLSSFDTSKVTSMRRMFSNSSVEVLDLSSFNTSKVTDMSYMFSALLDWGPVNKIRELDISSFDTSSVTNMSYMFCGYRGKVLDLSHFDTSNVVNMSQMFRGSVVVDLDLSSFNTTNVTNMEGMFFEAKNSSVNLSTFNTEKVGNMDLMFYKYVVEFLDLSTFDTSKIEDMSKFFAYSSIGVLDISSFDTSNVQNMEEMFIGCTLGVLDLSSFDMSLVGNTDRMFVGCMLDEAYARTEEDAIKLNSSSKKPVGVVFVVK